MVDCHWLCVAVAHVSLTDPKLGADAEIVKFCYFSVSMTMVRYLPPQKQRMDRLLKMNNNLYN
jgi:hypothetical protein